MLYLYTTLGCHLCEQAKTVLWPLLGEFGLRLQLVDIADDDSLVTAYGVRIPVIKLDTVEEDLGWPFDAAAVRNYLDRHRASINSR